MSETVRQGPPSPRPFFLTPGEHFILLLLDDDWNGETLLGRPVMLDDLPGQRRSDLDELNLADVMRRARELRKAATLAFGLLADGLAGFVQGDGRATNE